MSERRYDDTTSVLVAGSRSWSLPATFGTQHHQNLLTQILCRPIMQPTPPETCYRLCANGISPPPDGRTLAYVFARYRSDKRLAVAAIPRTASWGVPLSASYRATETLNDLVRVVRDQGARPKIEMLFLLAHPDARGWKAYRDLAETYGYAYRIVTILQSSLQQCVLQEQVVQRGTMGVRTLTIRPDTGITSSGITGTDWPGLDIRGAISGSPGSTPLQDDRTAPLSVLMQQYLDLQAAGRYQDATRLLNVLHMRRDEVLLALRSVEAQVARRQQALACDWEDDLPRQVRRLVSLHDSPSG